MVKRNRLSILGISDETKILVQSAENIGISKEELFKSFEKTIQDITTEKLGNQRDNALNFRKADLNKAILELHKEVQHIETMLETKKVKA